MIQHLCDIPPHQLESVAAALETGILGSSLTETAIGSLLGIQEQSGRILQVIQELSAIGVSGKAAAEWIRTVSAIPARMKKPEIVWSGPEMPGLYARDTRQVYEELLSSAEKSIWVSTYTYFDGPKAFDVLAKRMDSLPSLKVTMLLNIQRKWGDTTPSEQLVRTFADRLWNRDWPGSRRPEVYYDPRAIDLNGPGGVLHAKAVVTDNETAFITSANLTEAALDRNIELGMLYRDRTFALTICRYLRILIDRKLLKPLPL